jgi:hypothetical protein
MKKVLFLFFILISLSLKAQQPYAIELNENKSLPTNTVFNIYNDSKGFIWLATSKGLYRYDGTRFQVYKSIKQSSISGSDIKEDTLGRVWYQNFDGFLFYVRNNKLYALNQNIPIGYIPFGITSKFLFVVQKNGVDVFDIHTLSLIKTIPLSINIAEHTAVLNDSFYLISDDILYKIDDKLSVLKSDFFIGKKLHVKYIYPAEDSLYVISKLNETEKVYFFNENLDFEYTFSLPNIKYIQGSDFIDDIIWIHTTKGSYAYDKSGLMHFKKPILFDNSISKVIKDYRGNLWFSTINNGLLIIPDLNNHLINKHSSALTSLAKIKDGFLLGSNSGELLTTNNNFSSKRILHKISENLPTAFIYHDSIANNTFFANKGFYLVHNNNYKIAKNYDLALKDIVRLDHKYYAFSASSLCGIYKNPNASKHVKSQWDSIYNHFETSKYNDISGIINNVRGKAVLYDSLQSTIYFATNTGLFAYSKSGLHELKNQGNDFYATKLLTLKNKVYALSTKGNLFEITKNNHFINISKEYNIPEGDIQFIKHFDDLLLLACSHNIYTFSGNKLSKINFTNNLHSIYDAYLDNDVLIILTNDGIISLQLQAMSQPQKKIFHINNITINDSSIKINDLKNLKYNQNNLRIYFSLLDYVLNSSTVFYRINTGDWVHVNKTTRYLDFPSLAAGNYAIEFKIDDEVHPQKISFSISLPFWKTWWFYGLLTLIGVAIMYIYFKLKSRLMLRQIELLNEKITLEKDLRKSMLSTIKSQMNPHFFYNALNTIQAYIFKNDKQKANNYLAKFSKLTRIILEMSEKESVLLTDELDAIKLYLDLEQMRFSDDFSYVIEVSNQVKSEIIEFPPMLLQPYVENAIKHGLLHSNKEKVLKISINIENKTIVVMIDDNGIGRQKSAEINNLKNKKHQSFATQAIDKRLEILNKGRTEKITIEYIDKISQGISDGTTVILKIPLD